MAWQENEERGEEEVEVEGVVLCDEVKWGGEWRTSVMVAMKKALTCNIQKKNIKKKGMFKDIFWIKKVVKCKICWENSLRNEK